LKLTKKALLLTILLGSLTSSACAAANTGENSSAVFTQAAQIAFQALTETAAAAPPTSTPTQAPPTATATPTLPSATPTPQGTLTTSQPSATQKPSGETGSNAPCLRASFEIETIPDGTEFFAGETFTKTWRLKNTGSCTWTAAFSAIWVQGDLMEADSVVPFTTKDIFPGQYALISVNMKAPPAGHYKGYWMLRSADGIVFGVGTNGKEWFWVDIQSKAIPD